MNPRVAPFADLFKVNSYLINKAYQEFKEDDFHKQFHGSGNTIHWLIGHITTSRNYVGELFGVKTEFPNEDSFNGGQPLKEPSEYPSVAQVKKAFESVSEKVLARLGGLTDADIDKKLDVKLPVKDETYLGAISFFSLHDSYHVGQLSYVGKLLGYKGLTG